jgi:hypothetical protein
VDWDYSGIPPRSCAAISRRWLRDIVEAVSSACGEQRAAVVLEQAEGRCPHSNCERHVRARLVTAASPSLLTQHG